jgi:hypothetical protein
MLSSVLCTPHFFFSTTTDLTQTQQRLFLASDDDLEKPLLSRADKRFVWNLDLLSAFPADAGRFLLPLIHGAVFINRKCAINGKQFAWSVISRRSRHRVGTRFFARGCDEVGRVANFVETEQIVADGSTVSSFVQTRGSMPMFWTQAPDIRYMPRPKIAARDDQVDGFLRHFKEQIPLYGEQVIVNLIDQKRSQGELEVSLRNLANEADVKQVHYVAFDFHKECAGMRYDRLDGLMSTLKGHISAFDCFYKGSGDEIRLQKGVFRTNCMDCLDRTNVVQSLLATENLKVVLSRMGILRAGDNLLAQDTFQEAFKNVWADHADMISVQYSGTGALKTDFTRTGTRTYYGLLQDGWNSAVRYYLNNFQDGVRTDALRYFVGEVPAATLLREKQASKLSSSSSSVQYLPAALGAVLLVLAFTLIFNDGVSTGFLAFIVFYLVLLVGIAKLIKQNGRALVNYPHSMKKELK